MSEVLKAGDIVRVVCLETDNKGSDIIKRIKRGQVVGKIIHMQPAWATVKFEGTSTNYNVSAKHLQRITRRTFEEIVTELIATLNELAGDTDYGLLKINEAGTAEIWWEPLPGELTYYSITIEGEFGTDDDYTFTPAAHLVAIADACQEIAANYEAEQGKDKHDEQ